MTDDDGAGNALYVAVTMSVVDLSLVDHTPEELVAVTLSGLSLEYAAGIGPECNFVSFRMSLNGLQVDDQLSTSRCAFQPLQSAVCLQLRVDPCQSARSSIWNIAMEHTRLSASFIKSSPRHHQMLGALVLIINEAANGANPIRMTHVDGYH